MFGELVVVDDVAGEFAERVVEAYHGRPNEGFSLALSGGTTARHCYERLAEDAGQQIDWWTVDVYWGDERCVPLDDEASNYRLGREALLLVNLSGRGDKDMETAGHYFDLIDQGAEQS